MDLYQLRYFLEVARTLNFTRAAENLHISPPAVSRSVALLETSVGKKLFLRTRRRVSLTVDGELLKSRVEGIYDAIEQAELDLKEGPGEGPSMLRIGSREMITNYLFPGPLLEFKKRYPRTRFGIYELEPRALSEALKKDQVHLGFFYSDLPDPSLESAHLGRLRSHIYASKGFLGRRGGPRSLKEVLACPFIAPRYFQADPSVPLPDGFPDHRYQRNIYYEGEFLETHRRFVLDGVAVGVLPDLVVREEWKKRKVVRLEKGPYLFRDIYVFKRRGRPLPRAADLFVREVRQSVRRSHGSSGRRA